MVKTVYSTCFKHNTFNSGPIWTFYSKILTHTLVLLQLKLLQAGLFEPYTITNKIKSQKS